MTVLQNKKVGFLGSGNMAEALIKGFLDKGLTGKGHINSYDKASERNAVMAGEYGVTVYNNAADLVEHSDIIFLAVKPQDVDALLIEIEPAINEGISLDDTSKKLIISICAGVTTDRIKSALIKDSHSSHIEVIRTMPNTPALIGEGAVGIYGGSEVSLESKNIAEELFSAVGLAVLVETEELLNAVTALSGSGPAYYFLIIELMKDAGVKLGLDEGIALELALQTAVGSSKLALESDKSLKELKEMVTSKKGTTYEALKVLEEGKFKDIIDKALKAASNRSEELAK